MTLRIIGAVCGATTVAAGLAFSPAPWLALVFAGGALTAGSVLVDDGQPADSL